MKNHKDEEELKTKIFDIYSKYRNEPASDRRQVYIGQLWKPIYEWCLLINEDDTGEEIFKFLMQITKETSRAKIPYDRDEFFNYIYSSLENEKKKEKSRDKEKNVGSITFTTNNGEEIDVLNSKIKSVFEKSTFADPEEEFLIKLNKAIIKGNLEQILNNTQDRTRECYRSLFTAHCIDRSIVIEELMPLLDGEVFNAFLKNGKKPKNYEIYLKYHPEVKKESAEVRSSDMLKKFLENLNKALKEKN